MASKTYNADQITHLSPREQVRHRVGMFLGSNAGAGMTKALLEIVDNVFDEMLGGHGNTAEITFHKDGSAEIRDNARGLPVDANKQGVNGIILTVGTTGSGGKYDTSNYEASGGLNGVGAAATNFTSSAFMVRVRRNGKLYALDFQEGVPGHFADETNPNSKFTPSTEVRVLKDARSAALKKKYPTGTNIRFWPDFSVFIPGSEFDTDYIESQMRATSYLIPGAHITITDNRGDTPKTTVFESHDGLGGMVETLTNFPLQYKPVHLLTEGEFTETRQVLGEDKKLTRGEVHRKVKIDVAFSHANAEDDSTTLKSYVNIINTHQGGTHESGLWRALSRIIVNQIKNTRGMLKAKEEAPTLEDVRDGFVGAISVKFPEPTFTGQEKSKLDTEQITSLVSQAVGAALKEWMETKKNASQAKLMMQRVVEASRIRLAAKAKKEVQRKKSALETAASMPDKLADCGERGSEFAELFIVEGDSALGTMRAARDARYQALLPLRGKVLNVEKATTAAMLSNAECAAMIQVIAAGFGRDFTLEDMRYKKIIIAADADVDGSHIRVLLITFFWKYMREVITSGRLYSALAPLYEVKYGKDQVEYALDDRELEMVTNDLKKRRVKYKVSRNKGLGEMDATPTWDHIMNPEGRSLKLITSDDAESSMNILELAMGDDVVKRREWISVNRPNNLEGA